MGGGGHRKVCHGTCRDMGKLHDEGGGIQHYSHSSMPNEGITTWGRHLLSNPQNTFSDFGSTSYGAVSGTKLWYTCCHNKWSFHSQMQFTPSRLLFGLDPVSNPTHLHGSDSKTFSPTRHLVWLCPLGPTCFDNGMITCKGHKELFTRRQTCKATRHCEEK